MKTVGAYEAKTHLSGLLDDVARGQSIDITKHGRTVARLVPPGEAAPDPREIIASLREARSGARLGDDSVREMIEEGRR